MDVVERQQQSFRGRAVAGVTFASLVELSQQLVDCRRCPRLVAWREQVAVEKRAAFQDWDYWGRPVPGFGDSKARLVVIGLAPAAHGGNRTGRIFTGDRSGDWLFRALHRAGFASQPQSINRDDGLALNDCFVTAIVRCAPPGNAPSPDEQDRCRQWVANELALLVRREVVVALGGLSFRATLRLHDAKAVRFSHGAELDLRPHGPLIIASYHPSQQNTFTGRLTEPMFDSVFSRARALIGPA